MIKLLRICGVLLLVCNGNAAIGQDVRRLNPQIIKVNDLDEKKLEMFQGGYVLYLKKSSLMIHIVEV